MISNESVVIAARLMSEFATRSGLSSPAHKQDRYLWTDAFAVCNFLELFERTGDARYRRWATHLIDQVHRVLGRYRDDDSRSGWISGLDEQSGHRHPTAGGLRIGKPLKERQPGEPLDEQLEWDRDGQYFHYLTKWIHALCQAGTIIGNSEYVRWAAELADRAFKRFACKSRSGEVLGLSWKMSIDLSRALVPAMGLHDALDGFHQLSGSAACDYANGDECRTTRSQCSDLFVVRALSGQRLDDRRPTRVGRPPIRCLSALPTDSRASRHSVGGKADRGLSPRTSGAYHQGRSGATRFAPLGVPRARAGNRPSRTAHHCQCAWKCQVR